MSSLENLLNDFVVNQKPIDSSWFYLVTSCGACRLLKAKVVQLKVEREKRGENL